MSDFVVLGTDTDAGKTTFALLWLTAFGDQFGYWKPVETGESDTGRVRRLVPGVRVSDPVVRLNEAVAPPLAARRAGRTIPSAKDIAASRPAGELPLLIETFGGPLSPLNAAELQTALLDRLGLPAVLVTSSAVGAITRALTNLWTLRAVGTDVRCVVLLGPCDDYAAEQIARHGGIGVVALGPHSAWDADGLSAAARQHRPALEACREHLFAPLQEVMLPAVEGDLLQRDARAVWHPYTSLRDPTPPLPVVAARDEFLTLADGRRLIDAISSWWTILHGHRHPRLMAALRRAAEQTDHVMFAGVTHPFAVECAEELLKSAPWPGGRVFFSDNGSTAVEVALKMTYQVWSHRGEPQRRLFVSFENGYHGDTFGAMAVGRDPVFFGRFEPLLFETVQVPVSPDRLDDALTRHLGQVAAVIVEPLVQGAGGMRVYSPETLAQLHAVARRHRVLFIADEVMTCGRTGTFWAHAQARIAPDLICAAKTLAGGVLPLAATLASPEVVAAFDSADRTRTFFHGHSFTAHPLACAVAVENLRLLASGDWRRDAQRVRDHWENVAGSLRGLPAVRDVRVCGTILAVEGRAAGGYLAEVGPRWREVGLQHGVLLRPLGNVLYAMPPLCASADSLARIADALRAALQDTRS